MIRPLSQAGSTVRSALLFCLLIGGVVAMYLYSQRVETLAPAGGVGASFVPHDAMVTAELRGAGMQGATFVETAVGSTVSILAPDDTSCNEVLVSQASQICSGHRVLSHRDGTCVVEFVFQDGRCTN